MSQLWMRGVIDSDERTRSGLMGKHCFSEKMMMGVRVK